MFVKPHIIIRKTGLPRINYNIICVRKTFNQKNYSKKRGAVQPKKDFKEKRRTCLHLHFNKKLLLINQLPDQMSLLVKYADLYLYFTFIPQPQ